MAISSIGIQQIMPRTGRLISRELGVEDFDTIDLLNPRVLKAKLDRDPQIETHVDPTLLGGLIVKIGSKMIDSSLRTKLDGMRTAMRGH